MMRLSADGTNWGEPVTVLQKPSEGQGSFGIRAPAVYYHPEQKNFKMFFSEWDLFSPVKVLVPENINLKDNCWPERFSLPGLTGGKFYCKGMGLGIAEMK